MGRLLRATSALYVGAASTYRYAPALATIPYLRQRWFSNLLGQGNPQRIALTFDDGPDPLSTPLVLKSLELHGVKATFFVLGSMVDAQPYLIDQIQQGGHEVALHGQWHRNHLFRSERTIRYDLERSLETVSERASMPITHFRPPYGVATQSTLKIARGLGLKVVLWGAWGRDWRRAATPTSVYHDVLSRLRGGSTILLHDADCTSYPGSFRATLGAIDLIVELCEQHQWQLGPLIDHGF